jgi:ribonuclease D
MTAHRLLFGGVNSSDAPADLGSVFRLMLQIELPKDQGSSDWGTDLLITEQLVYAAHDVFHLHGVLRKQEAERLKAVKFRRKCRHSSAGRAIDLVINRSSVRTQLSQIQCLSTRL